MFAALFLVATKQFISPFNSGVETYSQDHRKISRSGCGRKLRPVQINSVSRVSKIAI